MNYKKIRIEYGHLPLADLPPEVRRFVESTPALAAVWRENARVAEMLRGMADPAPDPAFADRLRFKVRARLQQPGRAVEALEEPRGFSTLWKAVAALCAVLAIVAVSRVWTSPDVPSSAVADAASPFPPDPMFQGGEVLAGGDHPFGSTAVSNGVSNSVPRLMPGLKLVEPRDRPGSVLLFPER